jgi:hypothetical protein
MYELNRVRLYSIGPAGARYADTVLDLSDVGDPVPEPAPRQPGFFDDDTPGPVRRPAPAGVLFLENGGGKSVLLKLIFSVMLPGHRNTLGGASSGVLRKFLLADDCGHVALEWQHTVTGETVVVGKVSEWRGRQVSADPRKFAEAWYSFRPGPGLSLESLPVAEHAVLLPAPGQAPAAETIGPTAPQAAASPAETGVAGDAVRRRVSARGRRRTMKGFRDALTEAGKAYPDLDLTWEEGHDRWIEHLGGLGLDPELFRYQREMNADEGEAAGLFAVRNDADFTDLLLRAVTDTRDTDGLADLVHGFAAKLGRRAELTAERDFTAGSLDLLRRIAEAAEARESVRESHRSAERRTRRLARTLAVRADAERDRSRELAEQVAVAAEVVADADAARTRQSLVTAELTHRHASLALAAATGTAAALRRELLDARTLHSAWQATELVLRHRAAADRSARVSAAIREAERDAAPALAARTRAAHALVRALETAADAAEAQADREEQRAGTLQAGGEAARRDATAAATAAQKARSESEHLRQRLAEVEQETQAAVRSGWIDAADGEPDPVDPARAALDAAGAEQQATAAWEQARTAADAAIARTREAAARASRSELAAARANDALAASRTVLDAEQDTAARLAADPRAADLLGLAAAGDDDAADDTADGADPGGVAPEVFDRAADTLRDLLDSSVASAERTLFDLRTAAAADSRVLAALGDGGLLPPGPDVLATVEYLGEHGVPALPGWRYLAQSVDPVDHDRILDARPQLVDGVIVTDPAALRRAREVLAQAALLPRSAVAVGTAAALLAPVTDTGGPGPDLFLVPPNPAMHDENAADEERRQLRDRASARDDRIRELAARLGADRVLAGRLASWRARCPAGHLAALAADAEAARTAVDLAMAELASARAESAEAEAEQNQVVRVRDDRAEAAQQARRRADALTGLAFRLRERSDWAGRLRTLADEAAEAEQRQLLCEEHAQAADEDRRAAQRAADDARRTVRALRAERAELPSAEESTPQDERDRSGTSLPALREAHRAASQLYEQVGVGADLRAEQARAEGDETAARSELDRLTNKVRSRAEELLTSPDGADGPARQAAAARAEELVQTIETRASAASEQLGRLRGEAERSAPATGDAHTELPGELVPGDPEHAQALLRTATAELARRSDVSAAGRTAHADLQRTLESAQSAAADFDEAAAQLRDGLREPGPGAAEAEEQAAPHPGSLAEARQAAADTRRGLRSATADLAAADLAVRDAADALVRHANATRYEVVRTPARQQIRELPAALLPDHAAAWATAFAPRLRVLTDELEQLERNRDSIVDRLRGLVETSLATLRAAQRLSRLPEGLGEWSGQEFLRIRFDDPDHAGLTERLGQVIDEATRAAVRRTTGAGAATGGSDWSRRDGMSLLLRGVHAALEPRGVAVEILKPDAVLRAERVSVSQMSDVFSGGQLLTAAIALYCTMAALRSNDQGQARLAHAGTLFLDNPIGRANATYLIELQRAVASALGVQLIYTTGLLDANALAEFPLIIRLRNDADLRAGQKFISVEEHLRPGLPAVDPDAPEIQGELTSTRIYRRPVG